MEVCGLHKRLKEISDAASYIFLSDGRKKCPCSLMFCFFQMASHDAPLLRNATSPIELCLCRAPFLYSVICALVYIFKLTLVL